MDTTPVLKKLIAMLFEQARRNVEYCELCRTLFGVVAVIGFPLYYYVWTYLFPQSYENLTLRLVGGGLYIPIIFARYWPESIRRYLPWYWSVTFLFALPFFFTFMTLKNNSSAIWVESTLAAIIVMVILLDWVALVLHYLLGSTLAGIAYWLTTDLPQFPTISMERLVIVLFALVLGIISSYYAKEVVRVEQQKAMLMTASSIAHELRTPLLGIKAGAAGLAKFLPVLIDAYELARENHLPVAPLRSIQLQAMKGVLERIEAEAFYSNVIIDILLTSARMLRQNDDHLQPCSMASCVEMALDRYPFSEHERSLVSWNHDHDFTFNGTELLMVHVLFNLLKNALRHVAKAGKGKITIRLTSGIAHHSLEFTDTGSGVPPAVQPHIFKRFYTTVGSGDRNVLGAGIGLAFCRDVVEAFGGTIHCDSVHGEFTSFVISFPRAETLQQKQGDA